MRIETGTSYYPENWERERIIYDAELMKNAGIRYVRMGEFAWSHLELREGEYHLEWLEEAVRIFGERGILSVLCTPSAAAPAWLCKKYPSILLTGRNGEKAYFGVRHHTCYTSGIYREYTAKITKVLADHFKDNPFIAAWQIENEPGATRFTECFCEDCQTGFRKFLQEKYKTIEALNKAWKTPFWSGEYSAWDEIDISASNENTQSGKSLDSRRFRSHIQADFVFMQSAIIREKMPQVLIGTNNYLKGDRYKVAAMLDFMGNDVYPNYRPLESCMDPIRHKLDCALYAGLKPGTPPWILETPPNPLWPMKDLTKFFFYLYAGFGHNRIFYFPWGNAMTSDEKVHLSIVDAYSRTGPQYEKFKEMTSEADRLLAPFPELPLPHNPCAIVRDHDAEWMYGGSMTGLQDQFARHFYNTHRSICRAADYAEIISPDTDWFGYKLIALPIQSHISSELAAKMKDFVREGGVLVMNGSSGCFDPCGNHAEGSLPEHVQDLFGLEIGENMPCKSCEPILEDTPEFARKRPIVKGNLDGREVRGTLSLWTCYLKPAGAETILSFENSQLAGLPFGTIHKYGKGYAIYYAADRIDQQLSDEIFRFAVKKAGLEEVNYPETVSIVIRGQLAFLFNFAEESVEFPTTLRGENLLGNALHNGVIHLGPQDHALIALSKTTAEEKSK